MREKLLITGAAGGIGQLMMGQLDHIAKSIRYSDIKTPEHLPDGAEFVTCDLADADAVLDLVTGCDAILHLGGISVEDTFAAILPANLIGVHNIYEAARKCGSPRLFFASSNHVIGYYDQRDLLDAHSPHKPDGWYGVSKSYGEAVALMYYHKFGIETAIVRIGSCFAEPADHRMLATWMDPEDFASLTTRIFAVPRLGCPVIYGVSDNETTWWDNRHVAYLGWQPKHSSARFADHIARTQTPPRRDDATLVYQGGKFTDFPIFED